MKELVAVMDGINALEPSLLKRSALLFDRIAVPQVEKGISTFWVKEHSSECEDLRWLMGKGIVFEPIVPKIWNANQKEALQEARTATWFIENSIKTILGNEAEIGASVELIKEKLQDSNGKISELNFVTNYFQAANHMSRMFSCLLRSEGVDAYPVLRFNIATNSKASSTSLCEIILKGFPTPSELTPWEQILEYREDPDSKAKFLDLRNWMAEVTRAQLTPAEAEDKLEYLLSRYERHLQLHKMKIKAGAMETLVLSSGELLENLVRLKFGKLASLLFAARQRKIALLEGELTAPGNEVAYVLKTKQTFD